MTKGRPKGGTNKYWTAEEKYKIIKPILDGEKSTMQVTRETGLSNGMINNWIKAYRQNEIKGLKAKKPVNPMSSLMNRKKLTEYEN